MKTSKIPSDHLLYLQQRPFAFGCSTSVFLQEELQALDDYGNWMEALAAGKIQPATSEQEHFLRVDREEEEPSTVCERAWLRLKGRREYELEQATSVPRPPPENYGIEDWGLDRCWW